MLQQQATKHCDKMLEKEKLEDLKAQREADEIEEELAQATSYKYSLLNRQLTVWTYFAQAPENNPLGLLERNVLL